ncbi:hypothetical protein KEJ39_00830 [Candidatus Bathyarchaeota archaeon]|nr:hypothetical protein [Candidatus Bathyarchaeota archaeon]
MVEDRDDVQVLFLPEPQALEPYVRRIASGSISFEDFVEKVQSSKLVPEPIESWLYVSEPILRALPRLERNGRRLDIRCYQETRSLQEEFNFATEIALLTYRSSVTGEVEVEKWIEVLSDLKTMRQVTVSREAEYIRSHSSSSSNLCLSGLNAKDLRDHIQRGFREVRVKCVENFYHFTPLEILQSRLSKISKMEIEELLKLHLEYVNQYVLKSRNRDIAHYLWVADKVPWLRNKITTCQIEQMKIL